jgi:hypothetical protein
MQFSQCNSKNPNGIFSACDIEVKNGKDFLPLTENTLTAPLTCLPAPANQSLVNSTYKEKKINKRDLEIKDKSFYKKLNKQKHEWAAMKNESAEIEQHNKRKANEIKAEMPAETKALVNKLKVSK